ncbi:PAS domain S-box protein [Leeia sp. TBRC 13508]|uniref:histidine kinase n=1 Tax=Leeia speluncae TaxID=2884804 RepID=A0ABS8D2I1_9NEIS|nr:ATP-binding protein [Leeia speluncae]MCB6182395.1 PAS domain S-box protein [Leeia speluncae]
MGIAPQVASAGQELAEAAWIEVIQRMDQVYSELVASQENLEEKHQELADAHHFTERVLAAMTDVLVVCDAQGHVTQVNHAMQSLTGQKSNLLTGKHILSLLNTDLAIQTMQHLIETGKTDTLDLELPLRTNTGESIPVTWNISPLSDGAGRYSGFVAVGRPIGELKRAYSELQAAHKALQAAQAQLIQAEKMASIGRLVAGVAHELNNPISFILGNTFAMSKYATKLETYCQALHQETLSPALQTLREQLKIDRLMKDLPSLVDGLREGAERSTQIVDALKRFSAVEENLQQPLDLAEAIRRSLYWVTRATPSNISVKTEGLDHTVMVSGSVNQLQQVFVNLIQNAVDAVEKAAHPEITISLTSDPQYVTVCVADNGTGIPTENLSAIFDPFFTTKPIGKGTGLGLSISYGIVENHLGHLMVENRETGGAQFKVQLPLH